MHSIRPSLLSIAMALLLCGLIINQAHHQLPPKTVSQQGVSFPAGEGYSTVTISYILIPGINNTWGYDILVDNRIKIHQPSIPGLPGNEGFKTRENAQKVARLVINKIKKGELPPAVTREEMKKLNVL